jgi:asparagine synthase (glutamine-hydrolysing)
MCGIAGRFHPVALPIDQFWHERADSLLEHRGPDGRGFFCDTRCELVHRRLAIVDLTTAGRQPMTNEDGSVRVVFNGEIYNHRELRSWLQGRGHRFRSTADTEVLVHLYEECGEQLVERLRGMFAFAIYDEPRGVLLLARDRFGIKPLYFAVVDDQIVFASEMKAILALEAFSPTLDRQACYDFLSLGYIPEPLTGFANISALPTGTVLIADAAGHRIKSFHEITATPQRQLKLSDAVDEVSNLLLESVRYQSVADVDVGALLSGGIDSSLVVGAYHQVGAVLPKTFNVRFPDKQYDETPVALAVSKQYNTNHITIDLGDWAVTPESILDLLRHFDQPFADTSLIPTYWVSRAIRQRGIVCALSGDGGDEAFGGYARFWRANRLIELARLPSWIQRPLIFTGNSLAGVTRDWGRQVAKAIQLARFGRADSAFVLAGLSSYQNEIQKRQLVRREAREDLKPVERHFNGHAPAALPDLETFSSRMTENLFSVGLKSDMLRKVDMMSMRAGVEVRVPFLDERLVDFGLSLPHRLKTNGREGKLVLRELAARWLPREVATHPKHGFSIPMDVMVNSRFHEMLRSYLLSTNARIRSFINSGLTQEWVELFEASSSGHGGGTISRGGLYQRIVMLLSLEAWMRQHSLSW